MADSDWVLVDAPDWVGGKSGPFEFLRTCGFAVRAERGGLTVRTMEAYQGTAAGLVSARRLYGPGGADRLGDLNSMVERVALTIDHAMVAKHLTRVIARAEQPDGLIYLLVWIQITLTVAPASELEAVVREAIKRLQMVYSSERPSDNSNIFPTPSVVILRTRTELLRRMRLPSVLLRVENDPNLAAGSTDHIRQTHLDNEMAFPSSHALYEGIYALDPYIGPLRGAISPSVWCLASPRTFGTILIPLGRGISGTYGDAAEPLQTIMIRGPRRSYDVPTCTTAGQVDAILWWADALDGLFAVVSDPSVFRNRKGLYDPSRHLSAILTIEQLFRRVTSILVQHRDVTARQVLLFTCIDTLEGLTGRNVLLQFRHSQGEKVLNHLRDSIPQGAQQVLLPGAELAVSALRDVQQGFTIARQLGRDSVQWGEKIASFELASANYLVALRNATHGHGGNRGASGQRERENALLIQHNGDIPDDLPLVAYLYLLDLLSSPKRLRDILSTPPKVETGAMR